jgi:hypothetical protein
MRKSEDDDLLSLNLIHERKREAIEHRDSSVEPISPLRRCVRKLEDRFEDGVDLFFNSVPSPALHES